MWYLSGKEPHGTGDGTAVTERAARGEARLQSVSEGARQDFTPEFAALYDRLRQPPPPPFPTLPPFGMMGGFGDGGLGGPMLTGWQHHVLMQQQQAQNPYLALLRSIEDDHATLPPERGA